MSNQLVLIKITEWKDQEVLDRLKQYSVVDDTWFTRVVKLRGALDSLICNLQKQGKLKAEVVEVYNKPEKSETKVEEAVEYTFTKEELLEVIRSSYTSGGHDYREGNFYWCKQGSTERAEELLEGMEL
ncbi:hypothetical protein VP424E501_P0238 [Vibrio phage 424E50-1]|nr:hypothetical protein VP424E501_P0238 [Vibrio phage 424E50-1]